MSENNRFAEQYSTDVSSPIIYKSEQQSTTGTKKRNNKILKEMLNLLIILVVVAALILGILYAVKEAAGYESIGALLSIMFEELIYIWKLIIYG